MQTKNIEKMIRRTGIAEIVAGAENVWVGNGQALAPLFDFSSLTEQQVWTLFNVAEKDREKISVEFREPAAYEFADQIHGEELLEPASLALQWGGVEMAAIPGSREMLFAQTAYLAPFLKEDPQTRFWARWTEDGPVIAVKSGLLLKGLIRPLNHMLTPAFAALLENVAEGARQATGYRTDADGLLL